MKARIYTESIITIDADIRVSQKLSIMIKYQNISALQLGNTSFCNNVLVEL